MPEVEVSQLRFAGSGTALRHSLACGEIKANLNNYSASHQIIRNKF